MLCCLIVLIQNYIIALVEFILTKVQINAANIIKNLNSILSLFRNQQLWDVFLTFLVFRNGFVILSCSYPFFQN